MMTISRTFQVANIILCLCGNYFLVFIECYKNQHATYWEALVGPTKAVFSDALIWV